MSAVLVFVAVLVPLLLACLVALPGRAGSAGMRLMPWAAAPALLVALFAGVVEPAVMPVVLLETIVGLDVTAQVWLFFTAVLWTAAGVYAATYIAHDPRKRTFALFHLITLFGNLALIVAHDVASFYVGFAVMTFAGYGLVVHAGGEAPRRAGRIYLVMAVIGETMLLAAFILAATTSPSLAVADIAVTIAESPRTGLIVGLLLAGFGVKAGAIPLHMWLPLAHPVAPTPASAVLSGAMIKAGLLGWLRFLPLGLIAMPGWGAIVVGLGVVAAFFGVAAGITQRDPKTTLAYSSISQMGFLNIGVGAALTSPAAWPAALGAVLAYVVHHGLAKGALFLGVGVAAEARTRTQQRIAFGGLALAALSIAGAPLTSGSIAKSTLKSVAPFTPAWWPQALDVLLPLAALGSTLLMARFLVLLLESRPQEDLAVSSTTFRLLAAPWLAVLGVLAAVMWVLPTWYELDVTRPRLPAAGALWVMVWPVVGGALLAGLALSLARRGRLSAERVHVIPGDLVILVERMVRWSIARAHSPEMPDPAVPVTTIASKWYGIYATGEGAGALAEAELAVTRWSVAITIAVLLMVAIIAALAVWR